jgi:hypothetical protein
VAEPTVVPWWDAPACTAPPREAGYSPGYSPLFRHAFLAQAGATPAHLLTPDHAENMPKDAVVVEFKIFETALIFAKESVMTVLKSTNVNVPQGSERVSRIYRMPEFSSVIAPPPLSGSREAFSQTSISVPTNATAVKPVPIKKFDFGSIVGSTLSPFTEDSSSFYDGHTDPSLGGSSVSFNETLNVLDSVSFNEMFGGALNCLPRTVLCRCGAFTSSLLDAKSAPTKELSVGTGSSTRTSPIVMGPATAASPGYFQTTFTAIVLHGTQYGLPFVTPNGTQTSVKVYRDDYTLHWHKSTRDMHTTYRTFTNGGSGRDPKSIEAEVIWEEYIGRIAASSDGGSCDSFDSFVYIDEDQFFCKSDQ